MPDNTFDDKSVLVQKKTWRHQATSYYSRIPFSHAPLTREKPVSPARPLDPKF